MLFYSITVWNFYKRFCPCIAWLSYMPSTNFNAFFPTNSWAGILLSRTVCAGQSGRGKVASPQLAISCFHLDKNIIYIQMCRHAFILATFRLHELPNYAIKCFSKKILSLFSNRWEDNKVNIHLPLNLVTIKYPSRAWGNYSVSHIGTWEVASGRFASGMGQSGQYAIGLKFCQYLPYVNAFGNETQLE